MVTADELFRYLEGIKKKGHNLETIEVGIWDAREEDMLEVMDGMVFDDMIGHPIVELHIDGRSIIHRDD
jgi:hypothetical protein